MEGDPRLKVLMYHGIFSNTSLSPDDREVGAKLYDVRIENFSAQMIWLRNHDYTPEKNLIITFDDGEMNNFQEVFPVLKEFGWRARFFVIVKKIGKNGYMGWKELQELVRSGMGVGSHGLSHEILTNLMDTQIEEELKASKRTLELNLNIKIDDLSVPRGFCNDKIIQMAYALGYKNVFISDKPSCVQSNCLPRIAVKYNWTLKRFEQAMAGHNPLSETVGNIFKKSAKTFLRESGYTWVRKMLVRLLK